MYYSEFAIVVMTPFCTECNVHQESYLYHVHNLTDDSGVVEWWMECVRNPDGGATMVAKCDSHKANYVMRTTNLIRIDPQILCVI